MSTTPTHFERVQALFEEVLDLPESKRARVLDDRAGDDAALVSEVRRMLDADSSFGTALERPPAVAIGPDEEADDGRARIAGYEILREIGAGGMGVVYEAHQISPARRVALKVIRPGLLSEDLVRRFEFEADILARLQHPGVAQVFDAGTDERGEPYFAMEFVEGRPITEHAHSAGLDDNARLELFALVCDAVHHAHQKSVVHRDLKPSNILIDAHGAPKVLDFGVARLADQDIRARTLSTQAGQLVGSLEQMSPEQAGGDPDAIDTRSDVYSLGVVAFELLTGELPIEVRGVPLLEALTKIREHPPRALTDAAPRLGADLATVVAKALSKDPGARYASAAELGDDVRRVVRDEPILARAPTTLYQLRKFAKRNRPLVAAAALVAVSVVGGIAALGVGLAVALEQRAEANRQQAAAETARSEALDQKAIADEQRERAVEQQRAAEDARADAVQQAAIATEVSRFMHLDLLAAITPGKEGEDVTVREVVDAAALYADQSFPDHPEIAGAVHTTIGNVFFSIGDLERAEEQLRLGLAGLESSLGPTHELAVFARQDLGSLLISRGRFDAARPFIVDAGTSAAEGFGPRDPRTLSARIKLAELENATGDFEACAAILEEVLAITETVDDPDEAMRSAIDNARFQLASLHFERRDYERAEPVYRALVASRAETFGEDHPATSTARNNLAAALEGLGRYDEALPIYESVLDTERRALGDDHPDILPTRHNLAFLLQSTGRFEEAEAMFRDTLEACERVLGPSHPGTLTCSRSLGSVLVELGRHDEALDVLDGALRAARSALGPAHPMVANLESGAAQALQALERYDEAGPMFERAADAMARAFGPGDEAALASRLAAASCFTAAGDAERAVANAQAGLDASSAALGPDAEITAMFERALADANAQP